MNISWIPDDKLNFNISDCPKIYIDRFGKFHNNINNMYIKWHGGGWNIIKSYKNMKIKSSSFIRHLNNAFDKYPSGHKLPHQYKEFNELNWSYLCENPAIIYLFKYIKNNNIDFNSTFDIILRYNLSNLCCNPNTIHLLEQNQDKINWNILSRNPNAIHLLEQNQDKINWFYLSSNPNAIHLLENNILYIDWDVLSGNPNAIPLLEKNLNKINWDHLSGNPNAIPLLEKNLYKINWDHLSGNPNAIHSKYKFKNLPNELNNLINEYCIGLLEQETYKHNINWDNLSANPNAIPLLKKNLNKINWCILSKNPSIFS